MLSTSAYCARPSATDAPLPCLTLPPLSAPDGFSTPLTEENTSNASPAPGEALLLRAVVKVGRCRNKHGKIREETRRNAQIHFKQDFCLMRHNFCTIRQNLCFIRHNLCLNSFPAKAHVYLRIRRCFLPHAAVFSFARGRRGCGEGNKGAQGLAMGRWAWARCCFSRWAASVRSSSEKLHWAKRSQT